jgi:hypothetical protein
LRKALDGFDPVVSSTLVIANKQTFLKEMSKETSSETNANESSEYLERFHIREVMEVWFNIH